MSTWKSITVAVVLVVAANSQAHSQIEWDGSVTGGYTRGTLTGGSEDLLGNDTKHGFYAGATLQLRLADNYGMAIGARYSRKGGGGTIDSTFSVLNLKVLTVPIGSADVTLDYVEIPIEFVFFGDLSENSYFRGYLGPSLNILARAHIDGDVDGKPFKQDIKNELQTIQVSGVLGAGYTYEFESWNLSLDARYWQGITKLVNGSDIKTREFGIGVGVGIPLARD